MALMWIGHGITTLIVNIGGVFIVPSKADKFMTTLGADEKAGEEIARGHRRLRVVLSCVAL